MKRGSPARPRITLAPRPWSPDEDARLREICAIGLTSDAWPNAIPGRTCGEIAARRLDLQLELAPLL